MVTIKLMGSWLKKSTALIKEEINRIKLFNANAAHLSESQTCQKT